MSASLDQLVVCLVVVIDGVHDPEVPLVFALYDSEHGTLNHVVTHTEHKPELTFTARNCFGRTSNKIAPPHPANATNDNPMICNIRAFF